MTDDALSLVDDFRSGMRKLAAGVSIISTEGPQGPVGITATAVSSLTAEPPSVLCCVNRKVTVESTIRQVRTYCLNVLRTDHQPLAQRFAGMDGISGSEKFAEGFWQRRDNGAPGLADSLVTFECDLIQAVESYTHSIFIGEVTRVHLGDGGDPLVYCDGLFSRLATKVA